MEKENIIYRLIYTTEAKKHIEALVRSGNKLSINKLKKILLELREHPRTGIGKPEKMKYNPLEWSRRIDHKNRLVYSINNETITVTILQALGHYGDK